MQMFMKLSCTGIIMLWATVVYPQWLNISGIELKPIQTEHGGPLIEISYELNEAELTESHPAYIFMQYSKDKGRTWHIIDPMYIQGDGYNIVSSPGKKTLLLWGSAEMGVKDPEIRIRGLRMARVPAGDFIMRSFPAGGKDPFIIERPDSNLPEYYMAVNETTLSMFADYLNEMGKEGAGWHERMSNDRRCGIIKTGSTGNYKYNVIPGRENYPITYVSWYDAYAFLRWCGLTLPTEAMFEKAFVGGLYLDGDILKSIQNPEPQRKYPWGNEVPYQEGIYRCNYDGDEDGFSNLAPVGSFNQYPSPYGINDLAGNVAEWMMDWYTTTYHVGLDGFRMVRGGSWLAMPLTCDAVSGATQFPIKESSIMGFRGVFTK
jgi:formylglycine-generating enzyme required for sulfatase activity